MLGGYPHATLSLLFRENALLFVIGGVELNSTFVAHLGRGRRLPLHDLDPSG